MEGDSSDLQRFTLQGYEERTDSVIFLKDNNRETKKPQRLIIFFGGDVQDEEEKMLQHRDNCRFVQWSLEKVARLVSLAYQNAPVLTVKPTRMELGTFACYTNYVTCDKIGSPIHEPLHYSLCHLEMIIGSLSEFVGEDTFSWEVILVGFSKGCVVLNQIVQEYHTYRTLGAFPGAERVANMIKRMVWLDGGHCGGKDTWVANRAALESLAKSGFELHVFVTPYQMQDGRRPWIRKEEKIFSDTLQRMGAPLRRKVFFEEEDPSIELHFKLLSVFGSDLNITS